MYAFGEDVTDYASCSERSALRLAYALALSRWISSHTPQLPIPLILDDPFSQMQIDMACRAASIVHKFAPHVFILLDYAAIENGVADCLSVSGGSIYTLEPAGYRTEIRTAYYSYRHSRRRFRDALTLLLLRKE